jgi:ribosomal protein L17
LSQAAFWSYHQALTHFVDRMILLAKRGDDLSRREAGEWLYDEFLA